MANVNAPTGGRPIGTLVGAPYNGQANTYTAKADYATALYIGDPVVVTGERDSGHQVVALATAGATNQITGFIIGFEPTPGIVSLGYGAASTLRYPIVADAPDLLFELQAAPSRWRRSASTSTWCLARAIRTRKSRAG